jgi:hypothetical protein
MDSEPQRELTLEEKEELRQQQIIDDVKRALAPIVRKDLASLTKNDIAVLKARREYLNGDQLKKFDEVLTAKRTRKKKE